VGQRADLAVLGRQAIRRRGRAESLLGHRIFTTIVDGKGVHAI
jgi:hypothetical protein